jgi:hypothetical protein
VITRSRSSLSAADRLRQNFIPRTTSSRRNCHPSPPQTRTSAWQYADVRQIRRPNDYRIQAPSAAIDMATDPSLVDIDYDGHHRPLRNGWDQGAFEVP